MIKQKLALDLKEAIQQSGYQAGNTELTPTQNSSFGDYSTNIALQLAKQAVEGIKQTPLEIANQILSNLSGLSYLEKAEVAGPGFINFFIKSDFITSGLKEILEQNQKFGSCGVGTGKKARVEYVSANPTGPLHFGNARGGPIGDVLSSVLEFCGFQVLREYLDNDKGNQILELGKTLAARAGLISVPEEELTYKGEYTKELAERIKPKIDSNLGEEEIIVKVGEIGIKILFEEIIKDCKAMGIEYDLIVHESDLQIQAPSVLKELEGKGVLKKHEGALWFAPKSNFLKDREAVVVKSDGGYTYFVADIVYHKEKFDSGYDLVVDVLGSNTSGHVPKLQALAETLGFDLDKFKIVLYQFVRVKRGTEVVRMSKRAGNFITVREVLSEVGNDALRFIILMHSPDTHMDFDLELAKEQSNKNPVFYVQYAHARMANILNKIEQHTDNFNPELLKHPAELAFIKHLVQFPDLIEEISCSFQVHKLTGYAIKLADLFHKFYENCRVIGEERELEKARLVLVRAGKITLANTLNLIGVTAPERM